MSDDQGWIRVLMDEAGRQDNVPAPARAIAYWNLPEDARLSDVIKAVRAGEAGHRDGNHGFADQLGTKSP